MPQRASASSRKLHPPLLRVQLAQAANRHNTLCRRVQERGAAKVLSSSGPPGHGPQHLPQQVGDLNPDWAFQAGGSQRLGQQDVGAGWALSRMMKAFLLFYGKTHLWSVAVGGYKLFRKAGKGSCPLFEKAARKHRALPRAVWWSSWELVGQG